MRKIQKELLFIGAAPTAILAFYIVVDLIAGHHTEFAGIAMVCLVLAIGASIVSAWHTRSRIFAPLDEIISALYQHSHKGALNNRLDELMFALDACISHIEEEYEQRLSDLEETNRELSNQNRLLETRQRDLSHTVRTMESELGSARFADDITFSLCIYPLKSILGITNQINATPDGDLALLLEDLTWAAESLHFVFREFQDIEITGDRKDIGVWQLADDIIAILNPVTTARNIHIDVNVSPDCPAMLHASADRVRSLLFQYLLHLILHEERQTAEIMLDISYRDDGALHISTGTEYPPPEPDSRLMALLGTDSTLVDGDLHIPADIAGLADDKPLEDRTGLIIAESRNLQNSLQNRLQQSGAVIIHDFKSPRVSFCLVEDETSEAFRTVLPYLAQDTAILLLNSRTVYGRPNWHTLRTPLDQKELVRLLKNLDIRIPDSHRYRVLAVDDNETNLHLLELQLRELGHDVTTCSSGEDALSLCQQHHYDLVFLDIQMPGLNGVDATRRIRQEGLDEFPIIGLTAQASREEQQLYLDAGMSEVVVKPIRLDHLRAILRKHIEEDTDRSPEEQQIPVFDREMAISRANNRVEIADELFQLLVENLPDDLRNINQASSGNSRDALQESVHKLRGAVNYCGVPSLAEALGKLEAVVRKGSEEDIRLAVNAFNSAVSTLVIWHRDNPDPFGLHTSRGVGN